MSIALLGTNTEVGKTFVSASLALALRDAGIDAIVLKPVETGEPDSKFLKEIGVGIDSIYHFKTPVTPMLAAKLENAEIDVNYLVEECRRVVNSYEFVVVEGVGGVASPIWNNFDSADLAARLRLKTVLVSLNTLGSISSVITSARYLEMKRVDLVCVILNKSDDSLVCKTNVEIIKEFVDAEVLSLKTTNIVGAKKELRVLVDRIESEII